MITRAKCQAERYVPCAEAVLTKLGHHLVCIENWELSWWQLCCHWRQRRLSLRQPAVPPMTIRGFQWEKSKYIVCLNFWCGMGEVILIELSWLHRLIHCQWLSLIMRPSPVIWQFNKNFSLNIFWLFGIITPNRHPITPFSVKVNYDESFVSLWSKFCLNYAGLLLHAIQCSAVKHLFITRKFLSKYP